MDVTALNALERFPDCKALPTPCNSSADWLELDCAELAWLDALDEGALVVEAFKSVFKLANDCCAAERLPDCTALTRF